MLKKTLLGCSVVVILAAACVAGVVVLNWNRSSVDNAEGNVNNRQAIIEFVTTNTSLTDIAKLSKAGRLSVKGELD